jgi:hypothetical protein
LSVVGGVGVVKGSESNLKEVESSITLGGTGTGRVQGRGKWRECRCYVGHSVKHGHLNSMTKRSENV